MFCASFNNNLQFSFNLKLSHMIVGVFALVLCIAVSQAHLVLNDHEQYRARPPPINPNQLDQRTPSEVMVDLSNDLSFKILHLHSILNRNNFAFSPTALMCVLVALYEGSAGRSSLEMRNCLPMPNNRDIIRVGYRDIHRRLRTYFFDDENPLKGLSLNKENVTITSEFETILKFYGYDLGMDMVSSTTTPSITFETTAATAATPAYLPPSIPTTDVPTVSPTTPSTTSTTEETTTTTPTTITTTTPTTLPEPIVPSTPEVTTLETETTIVSEEPQPPPISTTAKVDEEENASPSTQESGEVVTVPNSLDIPQEEKANLRRLKNSDKLVSQPRLDYLPAKFSSIRSSRPFKRTRRHIFGLKGLDPGFFLTFVQPRTQFLHAPPPSETITIEAPPPPPPMVHLPSFTSTGSIQPLDNIPLLPIQNGYLDVEQGFLSPKEGARNEVVDHIFYINNQDVVHTTFKVYNSVLYYRYFEQMKMSILELEVDSTDYNLMILLPDYDIDLLTAVSNLRLGPTLRVLRKQLKPRWVQAIIPDFELHGTIFLTNDIQNLGVCDIFEPNRADFRPMTDESGIYVKHIEQNINVNIRTRPINHLKRSYGPQTQPIQVSVNHPFMFFIIDRDLDVATMAGRILNPLNVRIQ